jgi:hypothetical protein
VLKASSDRCKGAPVYDPYIPNPRHKAIVYKSGSPRKMYQGELAYSIRLAKQRNVEKLDLLLFQFAKAGKSSRLILSKEPGNVLLRVSYKWAIGYDWVSLGLSRI